MRLNQIIGIGTGKRVDLLCTVEDFVPGGIRFYVINGAWYGTLIGNELTCFCPHGNSTRTASVLYAGDIPRRTQWEYEDSIHFINERLNSWVPVWWYRITSSIRVRISRVTNATAAGCEAFSKAFSKSWDPEASLKKEFEDDIAF